MLVRYTVRATHKRAFMNIPASGRPVVYTGIAIFRIADGKIVEQWQEADLMGLMLQLSHEPLGLKPRGLSLSLRADLIASRSTTGRDDRHHDRCP